MLRITSGFLTLTVLLLSGCLTPATITPTRYYTISPDPIQAGEPASQQSLGIRPLITAKPYKLEMAYRAEPNRLAYFSRAEWAELPAIMVSRAIIDGITNKRLFADVGEATAMARPDLIFTGELRRFEADYTGETPEFVLSVSASIRMTNGGKSLWHDRIEVRVPLSNTGEEKEMGSDVALADIARAATDTVTQLAEEICTRVQPSLKTQ